MAHRPVFLRPAHQRQAGGDAFASASGGRGGMRSMPEESSARNHSFASHPALVTSDPLSPTSTPNKPRDEHTIVPSQSKHEDGCSPRRPGCSCSSRKASHSSQTRRRRGAKDRNERGRVHCTSTGIEESAQRSSSRSNRSAPCAVHTPKERRTSSKSCRFCCCCGVCRVCR